MVKITAWRNVNQKHVKVYFRKKYCKERNSPLAIVRAVFFKTQRFQDLILPLFLVGPWSMVVMSDLLKGQTRIEVPYTATCGTKIYTHY